MSQNKGDSVNKESNNAIHRDDDDDVRLPIFISLYRSLISITVHVRSTTSTNQLKPPDFRVIPATSNWINLRLLFFTTHYAIDFFLIRRNDEMNSVTKWRASERCRMSIYMCAVCIVTLSHSLTVTCSNTRNQTNRHFERIWTWVLQDNFVRPYLPNLLSHGRMIASEQEIENE